MSKLIVCLLAFLLVDPAIGANPGKHKGHPTPTPTASPSPTPIPTPTPIQVTLAWDASPGPVVTGYHLWMGFASGGETQETDVGNVLVWTVQLSPQTTYYFVVTAYNSGGDSAKSNEVRYTTP